MEQCMKELAEAREELAEEQNRTEVAVQKMRQCFKEMHSDLGEMSHSMIYLMENEAYRALPALLKDRYGIELAERLIRTEIGGEEINFFGKAIRDGEPVLIVGEAELWLDERRRSRQEETKVFDTLEKKIAAVRTQYPKEKIVPLIVTHYARAAFAQKAREQGVILVQSFEW